MDTLIKRHDDAYKKARGCKVYAPPSNVDEGEALYHATKSGDTSNRAGQEWLMLYREMKQKGLKSTTYPHLFR